MRQRRKPQRKPRNLTLLVELAAASLSAGHDAALSAKRAAECVDSLKKLSVAHTDPYADVISELAIAVMSAPGAESGYAVAVRALGTLDALRKDYGGDATLIPSPTPRALPTGVYYDAAVGGFPYKAQIWDKVTKKLVYLGRHPSIEKALEAIAKHNEGKGNERVGTAS